MGLLTVELNVPRCRGQRQTRAGVLWPITSREKMALPHSTVRDSADIDESSSVDNTLAWSVYFSPQLFAPLPDMFIPPAHDPLLDYIVNVTVSVHTHVALSPACLSKFNGVPFTRLLPHLSF